jgi:hypothetical protein
MDQDFLSELVSRILKLIREIISPWIWIIITCILYHCRLCDAHCWTRIWTLSTVFRLFIISSVRSLFRFPLLIFILIRLPPSLFSHIYTEQGQQETQFDWEKRKKRKRQRDYNHIIQQFIFVASIKLRIKRMFWKKERGGSCF